MRLLLDTHALLWWLDDAAGQLSDDAREAIANGEDQVIVSSVCAFEIATKHAIGKMNGVDQLVGAFEQRLVREGFSALSLTVAHALAAGALPLIHRDPFDRLLIAQARTEDAVLVSNEKLFDRYDVRRLW